MAGTLKQWGKIVRILCAVALLSIGFAHKPVAIHVLSAAELAAVTLPDGSVPELCIPGEDGSKPMKAGDHGCEACRLSATVLLPLPPQVAARAVLQPAESPVLIRAEAVAHLLYPPGSGPRAPPQILTLA